MSPANYLSRTDPSFQQQQSYGFNLLPMVLLLKAFMGHSRTNHNIFPWHLKEQCPFLHAKCIQFISSSCQSFNSLHIAKKLKFKFSEMQGKFLALSFLLKKKNQTLPKSNATGEHSHFERENRGNQNKARSKPSRANIKSCTSMSSTQVKPAARYKLQTIQAGLQQ